MLVQGTLDESNNVVIPTRPLVWVGEIDGGGGGSGSSNVAITNWPPTQNVALTNNTVVISGTVPVSGPLTAAQQQGNIGTGAAVAWDGTSSTTVIGILKAVYNQNAQIISLLNDIKTNTANTGG